MARYALVHNFMENRVQAIATNESEKFDVHTDLSWIPCPEEVEQMWNYDRDNGVFAPPPEMETHYTVARKVGYGDIGAQLGEIYDGLMSGQVDPLKAWATRLEKVKILFPKDNHEAVNAAQRELNQRTSAHVEAVEAAGTGAFRSPADLTEELADDFIAGRWNNPVTGPYNPS